MVAFTPLTRAAPAFHVPAMKPKQEADRKTMSSSFGAEWEMKDNDDEWYDTSSEDGSPFKKIKGGNVHPEENGIVNEKQISSAEEAKLLPYMPALFSLDLPPCGLEAQVAYEHLVLRLRASWLNHHGRLSPIDVVQFLKGELDAQNYRWPPRSLKGAFKRRKPWYRENVFHFQLRWIEYFAREVQAQDPELMTESEIMEKRKETSVPPELKLQVGREDVLRLWDEWNEKKRKYTPPAPDMTLENAGLQN